MVADDATQTTRLVDSGKNDRLRPSYEGVSNQPDGGNSSRDVETCKTSDFNGFSRGKKYTLVMCTMATFLGSCAFSLLGPFYTLEAEKKGMSTFFTSLVFAVFNVVIFISSPFFGNYLTRIGPNFTYCTGIFVSGVCNILFGTLNKCPSGTPFIVMSIVVRSVEAVGFSAFNTACFAIVSYEFPKNIGFVFGILEMGAGVGYMVGPSLGGALYELGGYGLPFYVVGGLVLLNGIMTYKVLPQSENSDEKRDGSMLTMLLHPMVIVALLAEFGGIVGMTTIDSTVARRFGPFHITPGIIGLFFVIMAAMYSSMSMVWGYLTDKKDIQAPLIIFGQFVFGLAFMILGPSVLLPFVPDELWTIGLGLGLVGFSLGCTLIPTMKCMINGALELNFKDNIDTYALASGLFYAVHCVGGSVGPLGSAALVQAYGYPIGYSCVALLNVCIMFVTIAFFSHRYFKGKKKSEELLKESLDTNSTDLTSLSQSRGDSTA